MKKKIRVAVLFGGRSAEHEVSLQSAINVIEAIDKKKYDVVPIGITKSGQWINFKNSEFLENKNNPSGIHINENNGVKEKLNYQVIEVIKEESGVDVVFPVLHGPYGEDGTIQGLLKLSKVPFVGAGVLGSAIGMDKEIMKRLLKQARIPTAEFITVYDYELRDFNTEKVFEKLGKTLFVKPANLGSSVGVSKVDSEIGLKKALETAFRYDRKVLIEEYIKGREIECSVLGNENPIASVAGEIIPNDSFYSYRAKYLDDKGASLIIPAKISDKILKKVQKRAIETFRILSCEGMARVDFFLTQTGKIYVNEINTIPGFTKISMYPKLWEASGLGYKELINRLIELAIDRFEKEKRLRVNLET